MSQPPSYQDELKRLLKQKHNKCCFDCGAPNPQWASLNNAIFLCLSCAGIHRGFGVQISFIRSITMDKWEEKQVERMKKGGNLRLKELFSEYGIPLDLDVETKYKLKVLEYYRKLLDYEIKDGAAENIENPTKPDIMNAFDKIYETPANVERLVCNDNFISNGKVENEEESKEVVNDEVPKTGFMGGFKSFWKKGVAGVKSGIAKMNLKEKAVNIGSKARTGILVRNY